jgi:pre-60S factor REI1
VEEREHRRKQWYNNKQSNMQKHFRVSFGRFVSLAQLLTSSRILCSSDLDSSFWGRGGICILTFTLRRCG